MSDTIDYRAICENPNICDTLDQRIVRGTSLPNNLGLYVCLTFDDGPTPDYTPKILDLLKKYDAKATFFVLGEFVNYYPEIATRIIEEGHEIGNHTFSHPEMTQLSIEELQSEILATERTICFHTKAKCSLFRPTYGVFRAESINQVESLGYRVVLWSRDMFVKDWELPGSEVIVERVLENIGNGSIILLHDAGGNREQTVEATRKLIPTLLERGYHFITVSELIELQKDIKNESQSFDCPAQISQENSMHGFKKSGCYLSD